MEVLPSFTAQWHGYSKDVVFRMDLKLKTTEPVVAFCKIKMMPASNIAWSVFQS